MPLIKKELQKKKTYKVKEKNYTFLRCLKHPELGWQQTMHGWVFYKICKCGEHTGYDKPTHFEVKKVKGPLKFNLEWINQIIEQLNKEGN